MLFEMLNTEEQPWYIWKWNLISANPVVFAIYRRNMVRQKIHDKPKDTCSIHYGVLMIWYRNISYDMLNTCQFVIFYGTIMHILLDQKYLTGD